VLCSNVQGVDCHTSVGVILDTKPVRGDLIAGMSLYACCGYCTAAMSYMLAKAALYIV